jgi:hypothetical protein
MRWAGGSVEILLVASVAACGERRVVVIDMALGARDGNVRAGERERCGAVIEGCAGPICGGMASGACCGETDGGVWWAVGSVVLLLVASVACGRQCLVVVVCVALGARCAGMSAGKRKDGSMIEGRGGPGGGGMAQSAIRREPGSDVRRILSASEVFLVASVAACGKRRVVVVYMALGARDRNVRAGKRERGRVVIECCPGPGGRAMAGFAGGREANGCVGRAAGSIPVFLVAGVAGCRR